MQAAIHHKDREIITRHAMAIAGVAPTAFRNWMDKGHYQAAPELEDGRRLWSRESLLALAWADSLRKSKMPQQMAGQLASLLLEAMAAHPRAAVLYVYSREVDENTGSLTIGLKAPHPGATAIFEIPVSEWRDKIEAAINNFYDRKAARRGRR